MTRSLRQPLFVALLAIAAAVSQVAQAAAQVPRLQHAFLTSGSVRTVSLQGSPAQQLLETHCGPRAQGDMPFSEQELAALVELGKTLRGAQHACMFFRRTESI